MYSLTKSPASAVQLILASVIITFECLLAFFINLFPGPLMLVVTLGLAFLVVCLINPVAGLMLLVAALPVRSLDYSLVIGPIIIRASQLLAVPTILGWVVHHLLVKKDRPLFEATPLNLIIYVFTFLLLISVVWGISIGGWLSKNIQWALSMLLFFMSISLISNQDMVKRFALIWIVMGVLVSIGAIFEFLTGGMQALTQSGQDIRWGATRSASISKEPNDLVKYLTYCLLFAIAYFETTKKNVQKVLLLICQFLFIVGILATFSRGAILSLGVGLGFIMLRFRSTRRFFLFAGLAAVLAVGISGQISDVIQITFDRLWSSFDFMTTATGAEEDVGYVVRVQNWAAAIKLFSAHPLLGIGLGGYGKVVGSIIPGQTAENPYSLYFDILVSLGMLGLTVFLLFMVISMYYLFKGALQASTPLLGNIMYVGGVVIIIKLFKGITGEVFIESLYTWIALGLAFAAYNLSRQQTT